MSADDQIEELKRQIEEDRQQKLEERRRKQRERNHKLPPEKRKEYRMNALARMTEEERKAYRKYNADRQKAYLKTVKPTWSIEEKKRRNRKNTEGAIKKRLRLAGRPKPETCEVCGRGGNIVFEHNHKTNKFRGWTCDRCNVAIGMVDDDIVVLEKLIVYLKAHSDE
jgi:hypothetical protein